MERAMSLLPYRPAEIEHDLLAVGLERDLPPIRRRIDGSIDYEFYIARGRQARSKALAAAFRHLLDQATATWRVARRALGQEPAWQSPSGSR
jgi:hypothetical protein